MSYILDALKKSEQERGHGKIPDVQTIHSASISYRRDRKAWWPYFLTVAVILNLLAIIYFNLDRFSDKPTPKEKTQTAVATEQNAPTSPATAPPVNLAQTSATPQPGKTTPVIPDSDKPAEPVTIPRAEPKAENTEEPVSRTPVVTSSKTEKQASRKNTQTVIDYNELPQSIRDELPVINVSAHVYSSNPLQRSIVINNNFMEEGEYVLDELVLDEITPDGAIFSYHDIRFHYGVVSGWQ